jgi:hypothetical protein
VLEIHGLNYWALLAAWAINVAVGSFWFSPVGFGKLWSKLSGVDMMKLPKNQANKAISFVILGALVQVLALGVILHALHATKWIDGLAVGLVAWAGFTAATTLGNTLYMRLSLKFWCLNSAFFLVVFAINSILLTVWR